MPQEYRSATAEEMIVAVGRFLGGEPEHGIFVGYIKEGIIKVPPTLNDWAYNPNVKDHFLSLYPGYTTELNRRFSEISEKQRKNEMRSRALIEYLYHEDASQPDIRRKYSGSLTGNVWDWFNDTSIRAIVLQETGYTDDELDKAWNERAGKGRRRGAIVIQPRIIFRI